MLRIIDRTLWADYECTLAMSVEEARASLEQDRFDLALCDIEMPGESGLVLVDAITRQWPETGIVVVTAFDDVEVARKAFESGAHGYLVKPFAPGQLLMTVMSALRHRELRIQQQMKTRTLEERIQLMIERAPVSMYIKDVQRRYVVANRVAHELVGLTPNQMIGMSDELILPPENWETARKTDEMVLEGGVFQGELTLEVADGRRTLRLVEYPFVDETGQVAGISGVARDVTAEREANLLQEELAKAQEEAIENLRRTRQGTVEKLAAAIELRDPSTGEHVHRMAGVAGFLAAQLELSPERVDLLRVAAPLHDVGKIAVSDQILQKPGPLTNEEREAMELHTMYGYELLFEKGNPLLEMAALIALTHQEWMDGTGYPRGLKGDAIPLEGRIVAVADVFDALTSDRVYRAAFPVSRAADLMREARGTHFDPEIIDILLANLDELVHLTRVADA